MKPNSIKLILKDETKKNQQKNDKKPKLTSLARDPGHKP
jgi:hypothetical protein